MQLALKSCTIRPWRWDDAESLVKHANNRKVWLTLWDLFPHPYTIQDAHEFLQRAINEQPTTKFCIEVNCRAVGGMGIRPGQDVHRHAAGLGYWLGEDLWRRGLMSEAVVAFTDFCFRQFTPRRLRTIRLRGVFSRKPGRLKNNVI
jgi:RimJ/RimL family protein N-acetyltransferase